MGLQEGTCPQHGVGHENPPGKSPGGKILSVRCIRGFRRHSRWDHNGGRGVKIVLQLYGIRGSTRWGFGPRHLRPIDGLERASGGIRFINANEFITDRTRPSNSKHIPLENFHLEMTRISHHGRIHRSLLFSPPRSGLRSLRLRGVALGSFGVQ